MLSFFVLNHIARATFHNSSNESELKKARKTSQFIKR